MEGTEKSPVRGFSLVVACGVRAGASPGAGRDVMALKNGG